MYGNEQPDKLSDELFLNPPARYRGAPFWAWNCVIRKEDLTKQIGYFNEMGMGGFHMHCRTGMSTRYLGEEFMEYVRHCNETAKEKNMLCWLYDEDRYASGYGGGFVTREISNRERYLVFSPVRYEEGYCDTREEFEAEIARGGNPRGYFIEAYGVLLEDGYLKEYERLGENAKGSRKDTWWVYLELSDTSSWWNNQTYVNTLNKAAIDRFIEVTHESYYRELGEDFGKSIPAIFTDEPQFAPKEALSLSEERRRVTLPFTDDFAQSFYNQYHSDILDHLPELVWELPVPQISLTRYRYHDHLTDRFVEAYARNIGSWCEDHNIALTGHMKGEENLHTQTIYVGEVMRSLRHFQLPGLDVLCDQRDYAMAKQTQSIVHQYGRHGAMSELYGVTNWNFDFKGHKMSGDWQAALGVAVRVHHLAWMTMRGEAKRDYPASINYQSPWYKKYHLIEDHFARVNTALTRGTPRVRIGVLHPIESYWLHFGPYDKTYIDRNSLENNYKNIVDWLLFGQLDFDFISEALMEEQAGEQKECIITEDGRPYWKAGLMKYEVLIVPGCHTLRSNTAALLERFTQAGGRVIMLGDLFYCVDGMVSHRSKKLAERCTLLPFEKTSLLRELENVREINVLSEDGGRAENIIYQMREDGSSRWIFLAHGYESIKDDFNSMVNSENYRYMEKLLLQLKGSWKVTEYDTMTGGKKPIAVNRRQGMTRFSYELSVHGSLLLHLEPAAEEESPVTEEVSGKPAREISRVIKLSRPCRVSFEEPNVFLLDRARYRINEEEWQEEEDLLKLDNLCRSRLGYPPKEEAGAQPWTYMEEDAKPDLLSLSFIIESEICTEAELALESWEGIGIYVNQEKVEKPEVTGWYVDEAIQTLKLPGLREGSNEIMLQIPYGKTSNIEACYLLGEFGVSVAGQYKKITKAAKSIVYGDLTRQGMPFYGGNVIYHSKLRSAGEEAAIKAQYFSSPLLEVYVDGESRGCIAFAPYLLELGYLPEGEHDIRIVAYGNRYPTFGQLHNCDKRYSWFGSCSWRTSGDRWSDEYQIKASGILCTPDIILYRR